MRRTQIRALEKLAAPCQRISRQWKAHFSRVPDGVRELRASFNVAFLAVLMEAMDWPDVGLCRCLLEGFPLAGNLADRDSGLFRLKEGERKAEEMATFQKGYASIRSHSENGRGQAAGSGALTAYTTWRVSVWNPRSKSQRPQRTSCWECWAI